MSATTAGSIMALYTVVGLSAVAAGRLDRRPVPRPAQGRHLRWHRHRARQRLPRGPSDALFFPGLALVAIGTGLLEAEHLDDRRPALRARMTSRRDSGFTIYYMGINIGAIVAPFVCGFLAQSDSFRGLPHGPRHRSEPVLALRVRRRRRSAWSRGLVQYVPRPARAAAKPGKHPTIPTDPARASRDRKVLGAIIGALVVLRRRWSWCSSRATSWSRTSFGVGLLVGSIALFFGLLKTARDARRAPPRDRDDPAVRRRDRVLRRSSSRRARRCRLSPSDRRAASSSG